MTASKTWVSKTEEVIIVRNPFHSILAVTVRTGPLQRAICFITLTCVNLNAQENEQVYQVWDYYWLPQCMLQMRSTCKTVEACHATCSWRPRTWGCQILWLQHQYHLKACATMSTWDWNRRAHVIETKELLSSPWALNRCSPWYPATRSHNTIYIQRCQTIC